MAQLLRMPAVPRTPTAPCCSPGPSPRTLPFAAEDTLAEVETDKAIGRYRGRGRRRHPESAGHRRVRGRGRRADRTDRGPRDEQVADTARALLSGVGCDRRRGPVAPRTHRRDRRTDPRKLPPQPTSRRNRRSTPRRQPVRPLDHPGAAEPADPEAPAAPDGSGRSAANGAVGATGRVLRQPAGSAAGAGRRADPGPIDPGPDQPAGSAASTSKPQSPGADPAGSDPTPARPSGEPAPARTSPAAVPGCRRSAAGEPSRQGCRDRDTPTNRTASCAGSSPPD